MTQAIIDTLREQISRFLPDAFMTALNNYQDVITHPLEQDETPKTDKSEKPEKKISFFKRTAEREDAARKCMAHLQLLLKLTAFLDLPDATISHNSQIILSTLMQEAEEELKRYKDESAD